MDSVDEKFPDAHFRVVGGYFFLRFMCPAIVSPPAYQLMASFPKKTSHRGLVLVAKLLQVSSPVSVVVCFCFVLFVLCWKLSCQMGPQMASGDRVLQTAHLL